MNKYLISILAIVTSSMAATATENPVGQQLFKNKCAMCHSIDQKNGAVSTDVVSLRTSIAIGKGTMPVFEKN